MLLLGLSRIGDKWGSHIRLLSLYQESISNNLVYADNEFVVFVDSDIWQKDVNRFVKLTNLY